MNYYTNEEFEILKQYSGQRGDTTHPAYVPLKNAYQKTEDICKSVVESCFNRQGSYNIRKKPTNQGNNFDSYNWGRVYPTAADEQLKSLAFTIGIEADDGFIVKIDTVQKQNTPEREQYEEIRGDSYNSDIVKILDIEETVQKNFNELVEFASEFINSSIEKYYEIQKILFPVSVGSGFSLQHNLNTIFYGPPGTGKTYSTVLKAAEIVENRNIDSYEEAREIFNKHLITERIKFITFHQNYSYEDFIQGLRPDVENQGHLSFERKDGIFTELAVNALFEYYKIIKKKKIDTSQDINTKIDMNEVYLDFIEDLKKRENKEYKTYSKVTVSISGFTKNNNIEFNHKNRTRAYIVSARRLLKLWESYPEIEQIHNVQNDIRDTIGGCNSTVYWVALKEFIKFLKNYSSEITEEMEEEDEITDEIGYETKKKLILNIDLQELTEAAAEDAPKYVIIIDEINRANISRVFGELITLIEADKRSHGENPLAVFLPSGERFIVPSNLYIIGTMNTADKSIALLDIALRRRFEFQAMYPLYTIDGENILDANILLKMNERIIDLKGYDFQIGHSYFMEKNKSLVEKMNKKVIPLLLEYFFNDRKEVEGLLEHAGLLIQQGSWPIQITGRK